MTGFFHEHVALTALNTLGIVAHARRLAVLRDEAQLPTLLADGDFCHGPRLILGGGSNLLITQPEVNASVLQLATQGIQRVADDGHRVLIDVAGGEPWHRTVRHTLEQGWYGLENLSLIPGTVGASPIQNIGAYGVEVQDRLHSLRALSLPEGKVHVFSRDDCQFGYRDSLFKQQAGRWLVLSVRLSLSRQPGALTLYGRYPPGAGAGRHYPAHPAGCVQCGDAHPPRPKCPTQPPWATPAAFSKTRWWMPSTPPACWPPTPTCRHYPQADGQVKLAAGWLIDRAGWKGRRLGPAGVHDRQALVLVNHGGATGADILALASAVQAAVLAHYAVTLEREPVTV